MKFIRSSTFLCLLLLVVFTTAHAQREVPAFAEIHETPELTIPNEAKNIRIGGEVRVHVTVDVEGNVKSADLVYGPGPVCKDVSLTDIVALRKAAREAAMHAKFKPARKDGKTVESIGWVRFQVPRTGAGTVEIVEVGNHSRSPLAFANTAINIPKPQYPGAAKVLHATGPVSIKVVVSPDGSVFAAEPISGHPLLRGAAAAAACKATFRPSQLGGKSVMVSGVLTYNFAP